jgi:carboxylate-amine ligase
LIDYGKGKIVPYAQLLDELLDFIQEDAEHFGCVKEVRHARTILGQGTSAHWQVRAFNEAKVSGADDQEALRAVVKMLIHETLRGVA